MYQGKLKGLYWIFYRRSEANANYNNVLTFPRFSTNLHQVQADPWSKRPPTPTGPKYSVLYAPICLGAGGGAAGRDKAGLGPQSGPSIAVCCSRGIWVTSSRYALASGEIIARACLVDRHRAT